MKVDQSEFNEYMDMKSRRIVMARPFKTSDKQLNLLVAEGTSSSEQPGMVSYMRGWGEITESTPLLYSTQKEFFADRQPTPVKAPEVSMATEIPRRIRVDLYTPTEMAIYKAMQAVEEMDADIRLTEAGTLLQQAKDKVADYIDEQQ